MLSTLFLAATLAQVGSSGGSFPSSSSDMGSGSMGTPMGGVLPAPDPARVSGPASTGTTGTSGGLTSPQTGASPTSPSSGGTGTEGSETSGRASSGGTGTTGDSSTSGGTNSARPLR